MRLNSRLRILAKWSFSLVAISTGLAWPLGMFRAILWHSPGHEHELSLNAGAITIGWRPAGWSAANQQNLPASGWSIAGYGSDNWPKPVWWFRSGSNKAWQRLDVPLWVIFVPITAIAAFLWQRDIRKNLRLPQARVRRAWPPTWANVLLSATSFVGLLLLFEVGVNSLPYSHICTLSETQIQHDAAMKRLDHIHDSLEIGAAFAALLCAMFVFRALRFRRILAGETRCTACGYFLTGNTSGKCPECAEPTVSNQPSRVGRQSFTDKLSDRAGSKLRDWLYPELLRLPNEEVRNKAYFAALHELDLGNRPIFRIGMAASLALPIVTLVFGFACLDISRRDYFLSRAIPATLFMIPVTMFALFMYSQKPYRRLLRKYLSHFNVHVCNNCGYDLIGNTTGKCPECGMPTDVENPAPR